jgi:hypothetical protein
MWRSTSKLASWATISLLLAALWAYRSASAADSYDPQLFKAELAAGEFAPALATAEAAGAKSAVERDELLAEVVKAQAAIGERQSALHSIGEIDDDRVVSKTLAAVRSQSGTQGGGFGGNEADFDSLIDLIKSTVATSSWDDTGGLGTVMPFQGGVLVDAEGVLRPKLKEDRASTLADLRRMSAARLSGGDGDARQNSPLRKISLVRLERQVQLLAEQGRRPTEEMQALAGLERIKYVLVYPDDGDVVLAGPAGDWQSDREGRLVSKQSNRPVVRLDDLVVVLRQMMRGGDARFGCSIMPTQTSLSSVKEFVEQSNKSPLKPGQRDTWLKQLREKLGRQEIDVFGIDPRTHTGLVMVEADYRMKLVGLGLEESVLGVPNYLSMIEVPPGGAPPPMGVLRWWFTLNYDAISASPQHDAFELRGQGVQVQSENEMLTAAGQQVHTGNSDTLNSQFAQNFTTHFSELAKKYPIYAELQNICDLALVCALLHSENLPHKTHWHMMFFGDPRQYQVPLSSAPQTVDTVINHRIVNQTTILVGVSGGVRIDPTAYVKPASLKIDDYGLLKSERTGAMPKKHEDRSQWWWD